MMNTVLVVDDDESLRKFIARGLTRAGFSTVAADGGKSGIAQLSDRTFDAVVCDLQMSEVDGLDVLRFASTLPRPPPFLVLTGYGSVSVAVEAMKRGAADFLEKPVSVEELGAAIRNVLSRRRTPGSGAGVPDEGTSKELVGSKAWLDPFMASLRRIAATDATLLIQGETGTGKTAIAREIWMESNRSRGPFIAINCAAIPEQLMESELFGHVRGAFTSATHNQIGKVELANGGTLFLDEIGELKLEVQAKLLHLLQDRIYSPIGGTDRRADVRFVAATNRNLETEVAERRFRADLFYRLNVVSLTVPPVRDRPEDIPMLLAHFSEREKRLRGTDPPILSDEAHAVLRRYRWPGNIREIQSVVHRIAVLHPSNKLVGPDELGIVFDREPALAAASSAAVPARAALETVNPPPAAGSAVPGQSLGDAVRLYEGQMILKALACCGNNKSRAARMLNMKRTTLIEKLKKLDLGGQSEHSPGPG